MPLRESSPFILPVPLGDVPFGQSDLQTFYVSSATANLVFHAESANELWFPAGKRLRLRATAPSCRRSAWAAGSVYTVESQVSAATPAQLRADDSPYSLSAGTLQQEEQLPHPYPRVQALARSVTAHDTNDLRQGAVAHPLDRRPHPLLEGHPAAAGRRRHGRRVPLRQPGRLLRADLDVAGGDAAIARHPRPRGGGYVPGGYNPITDLYQVHADDAHAWVQVWFPGYGWQNFDPTAVVPLRHAQPRAPPRCTTSARLCAASRWCRSPRSWWPPVSSSWSCAGAGHGRRHGRSGSRAASSAPAGGPAGPADPARPWPSTPAARRVGGGRIATWGRLASSVEASAYGGTTRPAAQRAMVGARRRGSPRAVGPPPAGVVRLDLRSGHLGSSPREPEGVRRVATMARRTRVRRSA